MIVPLLLCFLLSQCHGWLVKQETASYLPGGWRPMQLDTRKVAELAKFVEHKVNELNDDFYWIRVTEVKNAVTQVVNGFNYRITLIIEPTGCLKEENFETCTTPPLEDMKVEQCTFFLEETIPAFSLVMLAKSCVDV
ncbi:U7-hexatoxin-Hi1a-like [Hyperolius riggenbachi]|uniref:U7-hexatoxin-Hi1a-like n=1 Tax=Hyperolius riggenbachi TaxID=752182 RepID=UPI0035A3B771